MRQDLHTEAIQKETIVNHVVSVDSVESTNDLACQLPSEVLHKLPILVVAAEQTGGRGRHGNRWWSGPGSLTFSLVTAAEPDGHPQYLMIAAALAVADAIGCASDAVHPRLKWPNDVMINGRKVAGLLIEPVPRSNGRLWVVGIGINTNCDLRIAPPEIQTRAISLRDVAGFPVDPTRFLINFLHRLDANLNLMRERSIALGGRRLIQRYASASVFAPGCWIKVRQPDGSFREGRFAGYGSLGQLRLENEKQISELSSGQIVEYG